MKKLQFYIDKAMSTQGFGSYRKLCIALGVSHNVISRYNDGAFPSDETMVKLAEFGGESTEEALMNLNMWRAPAVAQKAYASILQKITHLALILSALTAFTVGSTPATASEKLSNDLSVSVYYGNTAISNKEGALVRFTPYYSLIFI